MPGISVEGTLRHTTLHSGVEGRCMKRVQCIARQGLISVQQHDIGVQQRDISVQQRDIKIRPNWNEVKRLLSESPTIVAGQDERCSMQQQLAAA